MSIMPKTRLTVGKRERFELHRVAQLPPDCKFTQQLTVLGGAGVLGGARGVNLEHAVEGLARVLAAVAADGLADVVDERVRRRRAAGVGQRSNRLAIDGNILVPGVGPAERVWRGRSWGGGEGTRVRVGS